MTFRFRWLFLAALFIASCGFLHAQDGDVNGLAVTVKKSGQTVIVDASMSINATPREVWDVFTDFDHMAEFSPILQSSKVVARDGDTMRVEQTGRVRYGLLSFSYESVRDVVLSPTHEIRSVSAGGSLKSGEATTRLTADGAGTRIAYHSESVPKNWVPPGFGVREIEKQTRAQFEGVRNEILKRKNGAVR